MSLGSLVIRALFRVLVRRRKAGPRRPSWSLPVEVTSELMRLHFATATSRPASAVRREQDQLGRLVPSRSLRQTVRRDERLGGIEGTWLSPQHSSASAVLLYFHGGGYCLGSIDTHGDLVATLAQAAQMRTFTPLYRLAPEHPYPAALDDAYAVYQALLASGIAPRHLVIGGDSAGGGLSLALLLRLRAAGEPLPAGALLISPWVDLTCSLPSLSANVPYDFGDRRLLLHWADSYRGNQPATHPAISPLFAELSGLPPLCIFAGEVELLVDEAKALYEKARAAGVAAELIVAPDMAHDFLMMHMLSQSANEAVHHAARFLQDVSSRTA